VPGSGSVHGPSAAHNRPTLASRTPTQGNDSCRVAHDGARHRPWPSGTWSRATRSARYHISRSAPCGGSSGGRHGSYGTTRRRASSRWPDPASPRSVTVATPTGAEPPGSAAAPAVPAATPASAHSTTPHAAVPHRARAGYRLRRGNQPGADPCQGSDAPTKTSAAATIGTSRRPPFCWTTPRQAEQTSAPTPTPHLRRHYPQPAIRGTAALQSRHPRQPHHALGNPHQTPGTDQLPTPPLARAAGRGRYRYPHDSIKARVLAIWTM